MKRWSISVLLFILLLVFPNQSLAVEFSITSVKIDAYLQENGMVAVEETHIYEFDGSFNGITREVIPKKGAKITNFTASENGETLKVEKEEGLYKIHRKGADETITVTLRYQIENGMEKYQDVAQFYWPFFDSRNETSYENLTISIHPPDSTDDVIAFGYDEAFNTEKIEQDGTVLFQLGYVPDSTNGDIRVAYPANLFLSATQTSDNRMKEEILGAKEELIEQFAADAETREKLSSFGAIGISVFSAILLSLIINNWVQARAKRSALTREGKTFHSVPKQIMSIPSTIYFTNHKYLSPQAMAAALLDLVRKGYVTQTSKNQFRQNGQKSSLEHENVLMDWLFNRIGINGEFSFGDLTAFTSKHKNHAEYYKFQTQWRTAVKKEADQHSLYENKKAYRLLIGLSSLILLPFMILFLSYELFIAFFITLVLFVVVIVYALAYHPKTWEGSRIAYDWDLFKRGFKELPQSEWEKWSKDDQMRAYIYGLGISNEAIKRKNTELLAAFTPPINDREHYTGIASIYYIGPIASTNFHSADQSTGSSSSGSSSSGGGTGGGGGGSGAF
jgi:uncharacterized membrane protein